MFCRSYTCIWLRDDYDWLCIVQKVREKLSKAHPDQWFLNRDPDWSGMGSRDKVGEASCTPSPTSWESLCVIRGTVYGSEVYMPRIRRLGKWWNADQSQVHLPQLQVRRQARGITGWACHTTPGISSDLIVYPQDLCITKYFLAYKVRCVSNSEPFDGFAWQTCSTMKTKKITVNSEE